MSMEVSMNSKPVATPPVSVGAPAVGATPGFLALFLQQLTGLPGGTATEAGLYGTGIEQTMTGDPGEPDEGEGQVPAGTDGWQEMLAALTQMQAIPGWTPAIPGWNGGPLAGGVAGGGVQEATARLTVEGSPGGGTTAGVSGTVASAFGVTGVARAEPAPVGPVADGSMPLVTEPGTTTDAAPEFRSVARPDVAWQGAAGTQLSGPKALPAAPLPEGTQEATAASAARVDPTMVSVDPTMVSKKVGAGGTVRLAATTAGIRPAEPAEDVGQTETGAPEGEFTIEGASAAREPGAPPGDGPAPGGGEAGERQGGEYPGGDDRGKTIPRAILAQVSAQEAAAGIQSGDDAPAGQPASPVRQIAEQIGRFELRGGERRELELQLQPEHLGRVRLHLALEDGALQARIIAGSGDSRDLLRQDLQQLRQSLLEQGFKQVSVQVSLGGAGEQGSGGEQQTWRGRHGGRGGFRAEQVGPGPVMASVAAYGATGASRLDLRM